MMHLILQDLLNVENYLDDIIILGHTAEEHEHALKAVLHRFQDSGLKINASQCHFSQTNLQFLGHTVTAQGTKPDKQHLFAILQAPAPIDTVKLHSFLGLLSWYSKFIQNFASVVEPLCACLRKDAEFSWLEEAQNSFAVVKELLVNSPALALYNPDLPTLISTDASDYGLGAVFSQIHPDNSECTMVFSSKTQIFDCGKGGARLLTTKEGDRAGMCIARWAARLQCFNYEVFFRPGRHNFTADCLSHFHLPYEPLESDSYTEPQQVALLTYALTAVTPKVFAAASSSFPEMCKLCAQIQQSWPRSSSHVDPLLLPFHKLRHKLS
ncbi:Transposon Tf2-6 polyprotein [Labeo rohita]|uniref:ribonuclease H n=1 Tax=Labeo rohita TaxID=84645 RepID=A0ABQ8L1Q9_LABRO|nr:Transposon Tf2-6 polyprotein [Labeo rohita]